MNFLMMRSHSQTAIHEPSSIQETQSEVNYESKPTTTSESLFSDDSFRESTPSGTRYAENHEYEGENGCTTGSNGKSNSQSNSHIDVTEDDGLIIIPCKEVPAKWMEAPNMFSLRSLDRNFVFPGEQIHILLCMSACKQDTEIITPFKVAAVMNKNGIGKHNNKQNGDAEGPKNPVSQRVDSSAGGQDDQTGENGMEVVDSRKDVPTGESLLRMEDYRRQTKQLLQKFKSSHFFARIAESNEPLWTKKRLQKAKLATSQTFENNLSGDSLETEKIMKKKNSISAAIDRGKFDARTSGGLVRDTAECCSLPNGDIVVLLHVNIGVDFVRDPILEILQFEMYQERNSILENQHAPASEKLDTSGDLLKWLLPVDNSSLPPDRAISPPVLSPSSSIQNTSTRPTLSGSQLFSFGNFRSYSMSSLPQNSTQAPSVTTPNAKPSLDPEDWNQFSSRRFVESGRSDNEGLLSFRGVPLEPERFSVRCGLEGIFTPGRRWRKKIEIIQPVQINSVSVDCNTDDLLCVHVKNVSPEYASDIMVFVDAITIILEETSTYGPPLTLPITCIEAGNDYNLPNLALRRGEEHSFILKSATSLWKGPKGNSGSNFQSSCLPAGSAAASRENYSIAEGKHSGSSADQYAILVSCRCNYTESKLFFKQTTSWRPRISRDLMISVASEMSRQTLGSDGTQFPVQVLTLQASNMTSDDLALTVLAPASFTSPPSVVSLSNSLASPLSPFASSAELSERANIDRRGTAVWHLSTVSVNQGQKVEDGLQSVPLNEKLISSDIPINDLGCTHLWLQSRVPLGSVPSHSMATIKLEVLPLTDGIITLDSLQIDVKEKGLTYVPEHSLKIHTTSSISTAVI